MSHEDIQKLQAVGKEAQAAQKDFILKDDQGAVWAHIKALKGARVDFVLDNGTRSLYSLLLETSDSIRNSWLRALHRPRLC